MPSVIAAAVDRAYGDCPGPYFVQGVPCNTPLYPLVKSFGGEIFVGMATLHQHCPIHTQVFQLALWYALVQGMGRVTMLPSEDLQKHSVGIL